MHDPSADPPLSERLEAIRARYPATQPAMVAEVVQSVLATMRGHLTATETMLLSEVEELGQTIATAKAEIAALKVDDITASHIPSATDELDAIVAHTAAATDAILETCETLDQVGAGLSGEAAQHLQDATTRIYEACSFQDITGQRIRRAIKQLQQVETMLTDMMPEPAAEATAAATALPAEEAAAAVDPDLVQDDIDRMFA